MPDENVDPSIEEYNKKIVEAFAKQPKAEVTVSEDISIPEKDKESILKQQAELSDLPDEFNVRNIGDLNYLLEIFSPKYDQYNSFDYLTKLREALLSEGYTDGSTLSEFLFWSVMSRKLQIIYQRTHVRVRKKKGMGENEAENMGMLKEMRAISEQVSLLQKTLDTQLDKKKKVKDVVDLHAETMDNAEKFITAHIGEFTFACKKCGTIVNSQGLPHFAIYTTLDQTGEVMYHIFSDEMWFAYRKGLIPLYLMAFILRTSPEGVLITADARKEYGAKVLQEDVKMLEEEEQKLKGLIKEYETRNKNEDRT